MVHSRNYFHQLLYFSLMSMASGHGSMSKRLSNAYEDYLYKIMWERDVKTIPEHLMADVLLLKRFLNDDIMEIISRKRQFLIDEYKKIGIKTVNLNSINGISVLSTIHYKKAEKIVILMKKIHEALEYSRLDEK